MRDASKDQDSGLRLFIIKTLIVTGAIFSTFLLLVFLLNANFQAGPAFWGKVEDQIYRMADEPDLPKEKKDKLLAAFKKIGEKYRPYIDALKGE
jgi:hypothetical protein